MIERQLELQRVRVQDRNGVRVRVHEVPGGTTVEADCQCFGSPMRVHSNLNCPMLRRAKVSS